MPAALGQIGLEWRGLEINNEECERGEEYTIDRLSIRPTVPTAHYRHKYAVWVLVLLPILCASVGFTQESPGGFHRYEGMHILLISDVPPTPEMESLTKAFDAAVQQWTILFGADAQAVKQWKVAAFIMTDRQRFEQAGLIDPAIRVFREGHQEGDLILCKEQPSSYYRRHLLLHEGVHWFMEKALGGYGPGWWMEGIAEWQATHRWDGQTLECGVVPKSPEELPYWGRLRWITQDLDAGQGPSLVTLFRQAKELHRVDSTYAWSWMAATFFANHPRYQEQFFQRLKQPTDFSNALNQDVLSWIGEDMQYVQAEFNLFVTGLDYGVEPSEVMMNLKQAIEQMQARGLGGSTKSTFMIDAGRAWQLAPLKVPANRPLQMEASGKVAFHDEVFGELESEPQGITLRYVDGKPLSQLLAVTLPTSGALESTARLTTLSIGRKAEMRVETESWLLMRANLPGVSQTAAQGSFQVRTQ